MDDYISRQKLLKDIEQYHLSDGKFQHWVEVQPSADVQHWIPVTEHLPIIETDVLLTAYDGKRQFVGWIDVFGKWYTSEDEEVVSGYEPLAWMPLPEPYKDGEQSD